ncbi:MAG: hypothetical protein IJ708_07995 [Clostridia bacterium]|nr:hypothetical protein [Clostridia bacterium]
METPMLTLAADMYGCPNRCLHCWLGHMPNRRMPEDADEYIVSYFASFFDKIAYYSWLREPDFCDHYRERWERDKRVSRNAQPERFELASFYRLARDKDYVSFLREVGVRTVQLTFFGIGETQDLYVGRKGAYEEILLATDRLIAGGIAPRWQAFINEENVEEIVRLKEMADEIREKRCPEMSFFVHEGSCEGENRHLYPIRIWREEIPEALKGVYLHLDSLLTERECVQRLEMDFSHPEFPIGNELVLYVSAGYDVFYNFTHMTSEWRIGNLKEERAENLVRRILTEDTFALSLAKTCTWADLVRRYGDPFSERVFSLDDFKMYLFNRFVEDAGRQAHR